ncbi:MAG: DHH family phosphoesterase, partial [Clostridium sp.]|nr:DHH family phosphoesterase [Clostridium sp.]
MNNNHFAEKSKLYILIIGILIAIFFIFKHYIIGSILLIFYIILVIYNIRVSKIKNYEWEKIVEDFSSMMDISTRAVLVNSPFALAIIALEGNVLWYNQSFFNILGKKDTLGKNIRDLIEEVNIDKILNKENIEFKYVKINNKYYNIFTNVNDNSINNKGKVILLYFYEVTKEFELIKENEDKKNSIILMEVDNLDDVLKTTEEDKALILSAEIERTIKNYAQALDAMIIKYSSSKYAIITYYENIKNEMEKNFDILDEIREINFGNKLAVTLSAGIGCEGKTPLQNYELATWAKELALSRGGDQVVIKLKDKLQFYGGKTKEVEKRTKVKARVIAHALVNLINESSNIYIMGHINPDIDALGAAIGIYSMVKALGKDGHIILDNVNSGIENAIERIKKNNLYDKMFITEERCIATYDKNSLLILVDVNSREYVQNEAIVDKIGRMVVIDHHRKSTNAVEGALLNYIEPYASSTCELVSEMLQYMIENPKKYISSIEAEMMLAGIYVDTKNFYFKTGVRTFEAAAYLRQLGADIIDVKKMFAGHLETYLKKAEIISLAEVNNDIAIALCPPDIKDNVLAAQVADELLNITGVQVSFVLAK